MNETTFSGKIYRNQYVYTYIIDDVFMEAFYIDITPMFRVDFI